MVKATVNQGIVNLESALQITEGERDAIKKNPKKVKAFLADAHTCHTIAITEDGIIVSRMGKQLKGEFFPAEEECVLDQCHKKFHDMLKEWVENGINENVQKLKDEQKQLNNAEDRLRVIANKVNEIVGDFPHTLLLIDEKSKKSSISGTIPSCLAACMIIAGQND
jgi:hypothetical protein